MMVGHFGEHDVVGGTRVDRVVGTKEELEELGAGEVIILRLRVGGFPFSHTSVALEDEVGVVHGDVDALVAEFAHEAAVAIIYLIGGTTEVTDVIVEGVSIDMVHGHSGRYGSTGSHPDGMGGTDCFMCSEGIPKLQINRLTVFFRPSDLVCIHMHFSSIRIDADTDHSTLAVVTIERDTRFGASCDIANEHAIKEKGRTFEFRFADDFKRSLFHKHHALGRVAVSTMRGVAVFPKGDAKV